MHGKAHPDKVFNHLLDLLVRRCFLHGNNHMKISVADFSHSPQRQAQYLRE
jgi:hypothetical protein